MVRVGHQGVAAGAELGVAQVELLVAEVEQVALWPDQARVGLLRKARLRLDASIYD